MGFALGLISRFRSSRVFATQRTIGERVERRAVGWKIRGDPGLFGGVQRRAHLGARCHAASQKISRLERERRRGPTLRQACQIAPTTVSDARL